jgi:hypothetical protein
MLNKILTKHEMELEEEEHQPCLESIRPHLDRIHQSPNGGHMPIVGEGVMPRRLRHTPDSRKRILLCQAGENSKIRRLA